MQKIIEFEDKVALYHNSNIPDINKVNDTDMNEIKSIVNGSLQGTNAMGSIVVDDINCKNLFDFSLVNKSYSSNGITFTTNGDGTFTANGTATAVAYSDIITNMQGTGYYTLSGCPAGGSNTSYMQILMRYSDYNGVDDTGSGATRSFTSGTNYGIRLRIASGYVCNNVVFRPMIEKGSTATTYVPYKKIIKEENGYVKENTTFYANDFKCRNIYDGLYELGAYNTTTGQKETNNLCYRNVMPIEVKSNTNYVFSLNGTKITEIGRIFYLDANGSMLSTETFTGTFTTPTNCYYINWHSTSLKTDYPSGLSNAQIEVGSEATPYTPYKNFENEDIYSTNEMVIGRWIDGKTLYRTVVEITPTTLNTWEYVTFTSNVNALVNIYGYIIPTDYNSNRIPILNRTSEHIVQTNGRLAVRTSTNVYLSKWVVILEYTK
jgi:hypothetical protein